MEVEEIKSSRAKTVLFLLISLGFVAICVAIASDGAAESYKSWFGGAFFGLCTVVFAWLLFRPQRLVLAPTGFMVAGGLIRSPKQILWREVSPLFVYRIPRGGKAIGYNFAPGARKDSALIRVNRLMGAEGGLPNGWPGSPERMVERINAYRARALAEGRSVE
ncbi:MAG: hypothetical protein AB1942_15165 [Pseudomonadota bacterium]